MVDGRTGGRGGKGADGQADGGGKGADSQVDGRTGPTRRGQADGQKRRGQADWRKRRGQGRRGTDGAQQARTSGQVVGPSIARTTGRADGRTSGWAWV